jgi:uncharacterized protein (TIGR02611 family)
MLDELKQSWRHLKSGKPGKRFERQYEKRKKSGSSKISRILFVITGVVILAGGIFFLPAPGPGTLIVALGAALIARESLFVARILDWIEVRIRRAVAWGLKTWKGLSLPVKILISALALALLGAFAFAAYRIIFSG